MNEKQQQQNYTHTYKYIEKKYIYLTNNFRLYKLGSHSICSFNSFCL